MKGMALVINILGCILAVTGGTLGLSALSMGALWHHGRPLLCPDRHYRETGRVRNGCLRHEPVELLLGRLCLLVWILWQQGAMTVSPAVLGLGFFYALIPTVLGYILYYLGLQQIEDLSKVPVWPPRNGRRRRTGHGPYWRRLPPKLRRHRPHCWIPVVHRKMPTPTIIPSDINRVSSWKNT